MFPEVLCPVQGGSTVIQVERNKHEQKTESVVPAGAGRGGVRETGREVYLVDETTPAGS